MSGHGAYAVGRVCGFCGDVGCERCEESDCMTALQYATAFPWLINLPRNGGAA